MKSVPILVLALLAPAAASARDCPTLSSSCDPPARWASRHDPRDAEFAITTEDGSVTLVLTKRVVAVQLSDRVMHKIDRKLKSKEDRFEEHGALGRAFKTAILSSVRNLLDHSQEVALYDIGRVEYRDDRLIVISEDGDELFEDMEVDDRDVMESFSPRDAKMFVREFRRVQGQGW